MLGLGRGGHYPVQGQSKKKKKKKKSQELSNPKTKCLIFNQNRILPVVGFILSLHFAKEMEHIVDGTSFLLISFFKSSPTENKKHPHLYPNSILSKMLTCS